MLIQDAIEKLLIWMLKPFGMMGLIDIKTSAMEAWTDSRILLLRLLFAFDLCSLCTCSTRLNVCMMITESPLWLICESHVKASIWDPMVDKAPWWDIWIRDPARILCFHFTYPESCLSHVISIVDTMIDSLVLHLGEMH